MGLENYSFITHFKKCQKYISIIMDTFQIGNVRSDAASDVASRIDLRAPPREVVSIWNPEPQRQESRNPQNNFERK